MKYLVCLIACLACCCPKHPERPYQTQICPVWIDSRFSVGERDQIKSALESWNYALNGNERFVIESDQWDAIKDFLPSLRIAHEMIGVTVNYTTVGSAEEREADPDERGVLAWVPELGGSELWIVSDRIGQRNLHTIVMHELGHVLGVGHVNIAGSLMFPYYPMQRDEIDSLTCALVLEAHVKYHWAGLRCGG